MAGQETATFQKQNKLHIHHPNMSPTICTRCRLGIFSKSILQTYPCIYQHCPLQFTNYGSSQTRLPTQKNSAKLKLEKSPPVPTLEIMPPLSKRFGKNKVHWTPVKGQTTSGTHAAVTVVLAQG